MTIGKSSIINIYPIINVLVQNSEKVLQLWEHSRYYFSSFYHWNTVPWDLRVPMSPAGETSIRTTDVRLPGSFSEGQKTSFWLPKTGGLSDG